MSDVARWNLPRTARRQEAERQHDERIEQAEKTLRSLKTRASRAIRALDDRQQRNHFREAVENMIQGTR